LSLDPERLYSYPPIVGNTIGTSENLSQSISRILNQEPSPLHQVLAFRYINVSRFSALFQETDTLNSTTSKVLFFYRRLIPRLGIARIPFFVGYLGKQLGLKSNRDSFESVSGVDFIIDGGGSSMEIAQSDEFEYRYEFIEMNLVQNSVLALKKSYGLD
jgi:hypothetical protein